MVKQPTVKEALRRGRLGHILRKLRKKRVRVHGKRVRPEIQPKVLQHLSSAYCLS